MHNDEYRKTFMRFTQSGLLSPAKKKTTRLVKLPSVRGPQQDSGNYILGEVIGEGGYGKVRMCTRKRDNEKLVIKIFGKFKLFTEDKRKAVLR
jgi:serine/threonine protein kinase